MAGVLQAEEALALIDLLPGLDIHIGDVPGIGGDLPGAVYIQLPAAQALPGPGGQRDFRPGLIALVLQRHGERPLHIGFHAALSLAAVGKAHNNFFPGAQLSVRLRFNGHQPVQAQHRQGAFVQHQLRHRVALLSIDQLHQAGSPGGDGLGVRLTAELAYLLRQVIQALLHRGYGRHDADGVHPGYGLALFHAVPVFHQVVFYLHALRHGDAQRRLPGQLAAPQHPGLQLTELGLV